MRNYTVVFICKRLKKKKRNWDVLCLEKEEQDGKKVAALRTIIPPLHFHILPERSLSSAYRNPLTQPNVKQLHDHILERFFLLIFLLHGSQWNTVAFVKQHTSNFKKLCNCSKNQLWLVETVGWSISYPVSDKGIQAARFLNQWRHNKKVSYVRDQS